MLCCNHGTRTLLFSQWCLIFTDKSRVGYMLNTWRDTLPWISLISCSTIASCRIICEQSNKYARETIRRPLSKGSIFRYFPDQGLTVNDIVGFLSICVHMSLVHKPEIADYWSTCPILGSTFASSIMPRDKFCMILAVLHVSDSDKYVPKGTPGHDPLTKIRPVYEHMRDRYTVYSWCEHLCG